MERRGIYHVALLLRDTGVDRISAIPGLAAMGSWLSPDWNSTPICTMCRTRSC